MTTEKNDIDRKNIEAIYPLAPMQQAILYYSLRAGEVDPGFLQLRCTLTGQLNSSVLACACREVIRAHASLRASLHWANLEKPVQIVRREVDVPWHEEDLSTLGPVEQEHRIAAYAKSDVSQGFVLSAAPVSRFALFQLGGARARLVWSCHHALLDGWSGALVLAEVLATYRVLVAGDEVHRIAKPQYRDFIRWLREQDEREAESFWRRRLSGITGPTQLPMRGADHGSSKTNGATDTTGAFDRSTARLSPGVSRSVENFVRRHRLTLNTLVQGVWALVLNGLAEDADVLFGSTVSGRDVDLAGIESMIGLFINTIPVRVRIRENEQVAGFLRRLQAEQVDARRYSYVPPERIQSWSAVPPRHRLYDSLVVVENFPPLSNGQDHSSDGLAISDLVGGITSNYPLTLVVGPGHAIELVLILERQRFSSDVAPVTLRAICDVIENIVCGPDLVVSEATAKANLSPLRRADDGSPSDPTARPGIVTTYVAPRDATELKLAGIWQQMLDIRDVGIRDDFFDLGGQSILAIRLVAEIEQAFGRRLPVATLFERSTIEQLATVLRDESWSPSWSSIVPMQTEGDGVPVFCLHSWTGDVLMYRGIARNLAPDHPVYGLQAAGLDGSTQPIDDMVAMARAYVGDIRTVSPTGPVVLVGRCFSGPLVLEMARQFSAVGVEVAAVINLDSGRPEKLPPRIRARWRGDVPSRRRALTPGYYLKRLRHLHKENGTIGLVQNQIVRRLRREQREPDVIETVDDVPLDEQTERVVEAATRAWLDHDLEIYRGTLTLIRSAENAARRSADWHVSDWAKWVDSLVTVTVPGEHGTMLLEPYVGGVAAKIKESISRSG